ncbi:hypothetical protein HY029_02270 [Candidatus Gottesmanbacteria bacterium]|nr:hypothetical protein [Candidatus Gottesmanbacteria bacterium]
MKIQTATNYLKTFYSNTSGDEVSLRDIFIASKRNLEDMDKNKRWLGNKTTYMKRLNLIEPKYEKRGHTTILVGIKLKEAGKLALERIKGNLNGTSNSKNYSAVAPATGGNHEITIKEVMAAIPRIRKENPEFEIVFYVKLKSG